MRRVGICVAIAVLAACGGTAPPAELQPTGSGPRVPVDEPGATVAGESAPEVPPTVREPSTSATPTSASEPEAIDPNLAASEPDPTDEVASDPTRETEEVRGFGLTLADLPNGFATASLWKGATGATEGPIDGLLRQWSWFENSTIEPDGFVLSVEDLVDLTQRADGRADGVLIRVPFEIESVTVADGRAVVAGVDRVWVLHPEEFWSERSVERPVVDVERLEFGLPSSPTDSAVDRPAALAGDTVYVGVRTERDGRTEASVAWFDVESGESGVIDTGVLCEVRFGETIVVGGDGLLYYECGGLIALDPAARSVVSSIEQVAVAEFRQRAEDVWSSAESGSGVVPEIVPLSERSVGYGPLYITRIPGTRDVNPVRLEPELRPLWLVFDGASGSAELVPGPRLADAMFIAAAERSTGVAALHDVHLMIRPAADDVPTPADGVVIGYSLVAAEVHLEDGVMQVKNPLVEIESEFHLRAGSGYDPYDDRGSGFRLQVFQHADVLVIEESVNAGVLIWPEP